MSCCSIIRHNVDKMKTTAQSRETTRNQDRDLMDRVAQGDSEAFEQLSERYRPLIYSTAMKVLNHFDDAQDVTNDVLISIWQKAKSYQSAKGSLVTWICTTTRNRSIDRVRSFQRRAALYDRYENSLRKDEPQMTRTSREELYRSDARQILESAVVELSAEQREVIELAYFEGLTQKQISDRLESPLGTVKARIRRGLQRLRGSMKDQLSGELEGLMIGVSS